ncbi:hypothetical protein B0H13DRAFT_1643451 [Mycena leptocephala]|nr:hypothetical protein B0H13DRAFT_1643451 [Mycena leptocephala]
MRAEAKDKAALLYTATLVSTPVDYTASTTIFGALELILDQILRWPLHKDDTLFRSGRPTGLNIYASFCEDRLIEAEDPKFHEIPFSPRIYPKLRVLSLSLNNPGKKMHKY